jgi:legumain
MFRDEDLARINAFVTTAANATESSWGYYCPPMDVIDGVSMNTCLGDLYSINWMQDSDRTDLSAESLREQYRIVKAQTNLSHVKAFGAKHIRHEIVGNFQSNYDHPPSSDGSADSDSDDDVAGDGIADEDRRQAPLAGAVNSRDVNVVLAFYKYLRSDRGSERQASAEALIREIESRERADRLFESIKLTALKINHATSPVDDETKKTACRESMFQVFKEECGGASDEERGIGNAFTSYSLQYAQSLSEMCGTFGDITTVRSILRESCAQQERVNQGTRESVYDEMVMALA